MPELNHNQVRDENPRIGWFMVGSSVFDRFRCWSIALILLLAALSGSAQEALQNAQAGQSASTAQAKQLQSQDYTFKDGDFRVLVLPSMGLQWNDNINLSQTNVMDDYIDRKSVV